MNQFLRPVGIGVRYPNFQLAKALQAREACAGDAQATTGAQVRVAKWRAVLAGMFDGSLAIGDRQPLAEVPTWATLEVVSGGFATGRLLAGGAAQSHEAHALPAAAQADPDRRPLNTWCLSEEGLAQLREMLDQGTFDVVVPEEGALLTIAWLIEQGDRAQAQALLDTLAPFFADLRFYPVPLDAPRSHGSLVFRQDVDSARRALDAVKANSRVLAQKRAIEVGLPLHDRCVALVLESVVDGMPFRRCDDEWTLRARAFLSEARILEQTRELSGKAVRRGGHAAQLRDFLRQGVDAPHSLDARALGRIGVILNAYIAKRGAPGSATHTAARARQARSVAAPLHDALAQVTLARLRPFPGDEGLDDVAGLIAPVTDVEETSTIPAGTPMPEGISRKVRRSMRDSIDGLVAARTVPSPDVLASLLPQVTAELRAAGIPDPRLRSVYAAVYRAFRRRRSLLLLDLQSQVKIDELPWVAAIEKFRVQRGSDRNAAAQALAEVASLSLEAFPQAIVPNKLLQEFFALAKTAELKLPFVEEIAADIFMGAFTDKYFEAIVLAGAHLSDSTYSRYYAIDYPKIIAAASPRHQLFRGKTGGNRLAEVCAERAGLALDRSYNVASNGTLLEQQQILTTQNLATLYFGTGVADRLQLKLPTMADACFTWICRRLQAKAPHRHGQLIAIKNSAYAWRQMVFYVSLLQPAEQAAFVDRAFKALKAQPEGFRVRFEAALRGLQLAVAGETVIEGARRPGAHLFLGWTTGPHWLLSSE